MRTGRKLKEEPIENRHRPEHELAAWSSARGKSWALLQFNKNSVWWDSKPSPGPSQAASPPPDHRFACV